MRVPNLIDKIFLIGNARKSRWNGNDIGVIPRSLLIFRANPYVRFNFPTASSASPCPRFVVLMRWGAPAHDTARNAELVADEFERERSNLGVADADAADGNDVICKLSPAEDLVNVRCANGRQRRD